MTKILFLLTLLPLSVFASSDPVTQLDLTNHWAGYFALVLFVLAYILVMVEEFTHFRKSKPVILVAGVIWGLIGWVYASQGIDHSAEVALRHNLLEYAELFLFLLVAMTYIEAMKERQVFESLKAWLVSKGFTFRQLFWMTGFLAFFISPIADNLTTALIMGAVVLAVGSSNPRFVSIAMINIVVAANAGGAFSPFGDITTLMVADMVENKLDCTLFTQGEYPKKTILEKHTNLRKKNKGSVIFGLDSFAEGVDLKGDNLTHVVIVKLRFSVPSSPIDKTLADYLQAQNRNPFMEISLPDASLRLIQACGRLIRTETDTGKITIFDNRLVSKFYGKQLIAALPSYNIVVES